VQLLSYLDYQLESLCTGCDFCDGTIIREGAGRVEMLTFFKRYRRRFTRREAVQILQGTKTYDVVMEQLNRYRGFGVLNTWDYDDIEEAIDTLLAAGLLRVPVKGFRKFRLTIKDTRR